MFLFEATLVPQYFQFEHTNNEIIEIGIIAPSSEFFTGTASYTPNPESDVGVTKRILQNTLKGKLKWTFPSVSEPDL